MVENKSYVPNHQPVFLCETHSHIDGEQHVLVVGPLFFLKDLAYTVVISYKYL